MAITNSLLGTAYYFIGDQARAQKHLEQALRDLPTMTWSIASQYMYAPRSLSLLYLAGSHWLTCNLNQAVRYAEMTIEEADKSDHPYTLSSAVGMMTSLYFWIDDLRQVERNLVKLEHSSEKIPFGPYRAVAQGLEGRYLLRTGSTAEGMRHLRDALKRLAVRQSKMLVVDFAAELAVCLAKQNDRAEALALAGYAEVNMVIHLPALLLTKALVFVEGDVPDLQSAEEYFERSMALARKQSALSYELRAGLQLAGIWIRDGELQRARDLIRPIYSRFSEGFGTPDLILAREILNTP